MKNKSIEEEINFLIEQVKSLEDYSYSQEMKYKSHYWKGQYDAYSYFMSMLKSMKNEDKL